MEIGDTLRRRINRPVFWWAMLAVLAQLCVDWLQKNGSQSKLIVYLPRAPIILFLFATMRMIQKMDELQKRICQESAYIAFLLTLAIVLVLDALDRAGIRQARFDEIGSLMMFLWGCAYIFTSMRYK